MDDVHMANAGQLAVRRAAAACLMALLAGVGCSNYIGTTAASFIRKIREDPDPNVRYLAYTKLASPSCYDSPQQKAEAVRLLVEKLAKGREPVASRAVICRTLGQLGDPTAREVILKSVNDPEAIVRVEACRALGRVGKPEDATVLARVMSLDILEDCRIAAIESLAELKPDDPRITRVLIVGLQHDDPATRFASLNALRRITGRDLGVEPGPWQKLIGDAPAETMVASKGTDSAPAAEASKPAAPPADVVVAPKPAAPVYPPQPIARPDPVVDPSARSAGYPPSPRTYLPR